MKRSIRRWLKGRPREQAPWASGVWVWVLAFCALGSVLPDALLADPAGVGVGVAGTDRAELPLLEVEGVGVEPGEPGELEGLRAGVKIGEGWETDERENSARMAKELEGRKFDNDADRKRADILNRVAIQLALIDAYPWDVSRIEGGTRGIMKVMTEMGDGAGGVAALEGALQRHPGDVRLARAVLAALVFQEGVDPGTAWAARRVLALQRAGAMERDDPAVGEAAEKLLRYLTTEGRLGEAGEVVAYADRIGVSDKQLGKWRGDLLLAGGDAAGAVPWYEVSAREWKNEDSQKTADRLRDWQSPTVRLAGDELMGVRWRLLQSRGVSASPEAAAELMLDPRSREVLVEVEPGLWSSQWSAVDRLVSASDEATKAAVRAAMEQRLGGGAAVAGEGGSAYYGTTLGEVQRLRLAGYRRGPWTAAGFASALAWAEEEARRGRMEGALKMFIDLQAHAVAQGEAERAAAGVRICERSIVTSDASVAGVEDGPPTLRVRELVAPRAVVWPGVLLEGLPGDWALSAGVGRGSLVGAGDEGVALAGPGVVAMYRAGSDQPVWLRSGRTVGHNAGVGQERGEASAYRIPGAWRPAVTEEAIYTRWGLDGQTGLPGAVVALRRGGWGGALGASCGAT